MNSGPATSSAQCAELARTTRLSELRRASFIHRTKPDLVSAPVRVDRQAVPSRSVFRSSVASSDFTSLGGILTIASSPRCSHTLHQLACRYPVGTGSMSEGTHTEYFSPMHFPSHHMSLPARSPLLKISRALPSASKIFVILEFENLEITRRFRDVITLVRVLSNLDRHLVF